MTPLRPIARDAAALATLMSVAAAWRGGWDAAVGLMGSAVLSLLSFGVLIWLVGRLLSEGGSGFAVLLGVKSAVTLGVYAVWLTLAPPAYVLLGVFPLLVAICIRGLQRSGEAADDGQKAAPVRTESL